MIKLESYSRLTIHLVSHEILEDAFFVRLLYDILVGGTVVNKEWQVIDVYN